MSATNQLQQNADKFYSDQYKEVAATFTAGVPVAADTFNSTLRFRKSGNMVSVEIILNGVGVGVSANIKRFDSLTAYIPEEYRPVLNKYGSVMFSNTANTYNQSGFCLCQTNGFMYMYPSTVDFYAGSYIQNSTFTYFI